VLAGGWPAAGVLVVTFLRLRCVRDDRVGYVRLELSKTIRYIVQARFGALGGQEPSPVTLS
jgi:hypothetical protein